MPHHHPALRRTAAGLAAALASAVTLVVTTPPARGLAPAFFPPSFGVESTAYTMRFAGNDRFSTAGVTALVAGVDAETTSGWPFDESRLDDPARAYGAGACPSTVLVAASDGLPDALAAGALHGLTNVAISGTSHGFDFTNTVLLLTDTARPPVNATSLSGPTKQALLALGHACPAFDAVILGGTSAVPAGAEQDLGYFASTVGRIAGTDRYDTAAQIAQLVDAAGGIGAVTTYASSTDPGTHLARTVFLAEARTGADALAASAVAANTHVPVLLVGDAMTSTSGAASLPAPTASALSALAPEHIVVLGGTSAVSDDVASAAATAAGTSSTLRIAGDDRYATSVAIAEQLDGVWPGRSGGSPDQRFAFARSEGQGVEHVGWPDALAAAPALATLWQHAGAPRRLAPAVEANDGTVLIGGTAGPRPIPLLLVTQSQLPSPVDTFLGAIYPEPTRTATTPATADTGGFGYLFGGSGAVEPGVEQAIAQDLSGGAYTPGPARTDLMPALADGAVFYTNLDLSSFVEQSPAGGGIDPASPGLAAGDKLCVWRGAAAGVQFVDDFASNTLGAWSTPLTYARGGPFAPQENLPFCVPVPTASSSAALFGISLSGNLTNAVNRSWSTSNTAEATQPSTPVTPSTATTGPTPSSTVDAPPGAGSTATLHAVYQLPGLAVTDDGSSSTGGSLDVTITRRGVASGPDAITCTGTLTAGTLSARMDAEGATVPTGQPGSSNAIACVGEYTAAATGGVVFTITGDGTSAMLSGLRLQGND